MGILYMQIYTRFSANFECNSRRNCLLEGNILWTKVVEETKTYTVRSVQFFFCQSYGYRYD
jgi:hypothetical protein